LSYFYQCRLAARGPSQFMESYNGFMD